MKTTYVKNILLITVIIILSGCMYPDEELEKNKIPNEQQLEMVQNAVNQYQEETNGLLPLKTKDSDTPIFEKYLIDFSMLKERNILTDIPGTAFENGGVYQYALMDVEGENPKVKLIDLRLTEELRSVNVKLNLYRDQNLYPPFGEQIESGVFSIDYEKLKLDAPPVVRSPYTGENLPIIMDTMGNLYIDYRIDLNRALDDYEHEYVEGDDIRFLLAENAPFLPAYSLPYTAKENEPVFMDLN